MAGTEEFWKKNEGKMKEDLIEIDAGRDKREITTFDFIISIGSKNSALQKVCRCCLLIF